MIESDAGGILLSGEISLHNLMAYREALEKTLATLTPAGQSQGELAVNLSELEIIDSAALSLLVFIVRQTRGTFDTVRFVGCNKNLRDMAAMAELDELLELTTA